MDTDASAHLDTDAGAYLDAGSRSRYGDSHSGSSSDGYDRLVGVAAEFSGSYGNAQTNFYGDA